MDKSLEALAGLLDEVRSGRFSGVVVMSWARGSRVLTSVGLTNLRSNAPIVHALLESLKLCGAVDDAWFVRFTAAGAGEKERMMREALGRLPEHPGGKGDANIMFG